MSISVKTLTELSCDFDNCDRKTPIPCATSPLPEGWCNIEVGENQLHACTGLHLALAVLQNVGLDREAISIYEAIYEKKYKHV